MAALPNLRRAIGNRISTTLDGAINASILSITVVDATGMDTDGGYIIIDEADAAKREIVYVESISGNILTVSTSGRGLAGTTAVSHDSGVTVTDIVVDENVNGIIDTFEIGHTDAGLHVLPNNTALSIKESGGTAREVVKVTSGNIVQVGYNTLPIQTIGKWDGWNAIGDTWTYASATTITVPAGAATYYAVGDKIKLTQTTAKYFYVVAVADELLTVTGGSDYTVANAAITDIYVSKMESPVGFPSSFNWASLNMRGTSGYTLSSVTVEVSKFKISGRTVTWWFGSYGTGGGSAYSVILYTPPTTTSMAFATHLGHGRYWEGGTFNTAICYVNSPTTAFAVEKHNAGNWATSGDVGNRFLIQYLL